MKPKYPDITVELVGQDGNAFAILGAVKRQLCRAEVPSEEIERYVDEATAGDYNELLRVTMDWVEVE